MKILETIKEKLILKIIFIMKLKIKLNIKIPTDKVIVLRRELKGPG